MKKYELIQALESFDDETDIRVVHTNGTGLCDIISADYVMSNNDDPAYVILKIPNEHIGAGHIVMGADGVR